MAKEYEPQLPFDIPFKLLKRTSTKINGVTQENFEEQKEVLFCSAKSYGGTEKVVNGVSVIEDTWYVDTWYNPSLNKGDKIRLLDTNEEFEILASPENINRHGVYMRFKVVKIGG